MYEKSPCYEPISRTFINPAVLVHQLIAAAHTPENAKAWAAKCPAWTNADPDPSRPGAPTRQPRQPLQPATR
ncbi:hypothetical protein [Streptomyces sp. PT12]|uniref:hypothetical protein n=1 Tax=Streptomyces sp. PT12 TaxID=1510197 RepID=UPI000DE1FA3E|nr:hypothetical protein [Streptomyces sp. PT12]RBM23307.1 hypothetical protein DEH69_03040 [Streptomyces sp. PT12]